MLIFKNKMHRERLECEVCIFPPMKDYADIIKYPLKDFRFKAVVDTGASKSVITSKVIRKIGLHYISDGLPVMIGSGEFVRTKMWAGSFGFIKNDIPYVFNKKHEFFEIQSSKSIIIDALIGLDIIAQTVFLCKDNFFEFNVKENRFFETRFVS